MNNPENERLIPKVPAQRQASEPIRRLPKQRDRRAS